jgi:hypothetical protein
MNWTGSVVFFLAAGVGALLPGRSPSAPPVPHLAAAPTSGEVEAELEMTGIQATDRGESGILELSLGHGFKGDARASYIFEIRDDRGRLVAGSKLQAKPFAIEKGGARAFTFETGALPDGFYRANVTVAAKGDVDESLAISREVYLESRGGELIPLEFTDFADRSAYNLGEIR